MTKKIAFPPVRDVGDLPAPVTVAGDVHLTVEEPEVARRFVRFLSEVARQGGSLILIGDLFDWWIGHRQAARDPFARQIVEALSTVAGRGVRLAFLGGNRDYAFDGAPGLDIEIWPDVVRTRWGQETVVLSHGDLLCSADRGYQTLRWMLRGGVGRAVQHSLPYAACVYIARGLRDLSDRSTRRKTGTELGIDYGLAAQWLNHYRADTLVVGHVHTGVHHRPDADPTKNVYVLKDWSRTANAVMFDGCQTRVAKFATRV